MRAVTDSGPAVPNQEKPEAIKNIFQLMGVVSPADTLKHFEDAYNSCSIRYGDMKKQLAEDMIVFTAPLREKINELSRDEDFIHKTATRGAEKARESASATLSEARRLIGFRHF